MLKLIGASEKTAIVGKDIEISYSQLLDRILEFSHHIPFNKGQRIVIFSGNRVEWIYALYASWIKEAIVVPVDAMSTAEDVAYILNDCKPGLIFTSSEKSGLVSEAQNIAGDNTSVVVFENAAKTDSGSAYAESSLQSNAEEEKILSHGTDTNEIAIRDIARTALILYTSGTTGNPKGVMLSFENILTNLNAVCRDVQIFTPADRVMILLPLHHILPLVGTIIAPFYVNATVVFKHVNGCRRTAFNAKQVWGYNNDRCPQVISTDL
jgi:long-chain acyl-CoA synthetase